MKLLVLLISFVAVALSQPTVSAITFDGVGDSSARANFNVSGTYSDFRARFIADADGTCTSGTGGVVQDYTSTPKLLFGMTAQLSGLAPSTLYNVCIEATSNGADWSSGVSAQFTTLARTVTEPEAPETVSMVFPAQGGAMYTVVLDCDDSMTGLQHFLNIAVPGDTIVVPKGLPCEGTYTVPAALDLIPFLPGNVVTSTSTITIAGHGLMDNEEIQFTTGGVPDNCLPGSQIFPGQVNTCDKGPGWNKSDKYYVNVTDASHVQILDAPNGTPVVPGQIHFTCNSGANTITYTPNAFYQGFRTKTGLVDANTIVQFVSDGMLCGGLNPDVNYFLLSSCSVSTSAVCTTSVSLMSSGSVVDITSSGMGTHTIVDQGAGTLYILRAPTQTGPWIVVTTDGDIAPPGVRAFADEDDEYFNFNQTTYSAVSNLVFGVGAHNWRFVGARFTADGNNDYLQTIDPRSFCVGPNTNQDNRYIVFDRIIVEGLGYPNRTGCRGGAANMFWDGGYISFINSRLTDLNFWHAWYGSTSGLNSGMSLSRMSNIITMTAGHANLGVVAVDFSGDTTVELTAGTGTGYVYIDMAGVLQVLLPTGATAVCMSSVTCNVGTTASPGFPTVSLGGSTRAAGLPLFTFPFSAGSITSNPTAQARAPVGNTGNSSPGSAVASEGANAIIGGPGPGPYLIYNNYISGAGLTLHFAEGGGPLFVGHDYSILQNTFDVDLETLLNGTDSDDHWYGNRQPLEWKSGQRILVSGNNFKNCYAQSNPEGTCIVMTPVTGGYSTDINISDNQFTNVVGPIMFGNPTSAFAPMSRPVARQLFCNNVALITSWDRYAPTESFPLGWSFHGGNAAEDISICHNTIFNNKGQINPFFRIAWNPISGVSMTDNIYFFTGESATFGMMAGEQQPAACTQDEAFMNNCLLNGYTGGDVPNPAYTFTGNLIIPSYANSETDSSLVSRGTVTAAFPTLTPVTNYVPTAKASVEDYVLFVKWVCGSLAACSATDTPNLQLEPTSPYISAGTGGTPVGVEDFSAFEDALGRIGTVSVSSVTSNSAIVNIQAPSTFGCPVDWSTTMGLPPGDYTRVSNAGGTQTQLVNLTGLPSSTTIYYRVDCAAEVFESSFATSAIDSVSSLKGPTNVKGPSGVR